MICHEPWYFVLGFSFFLSKTGRAPWDCIRLLPKCMRPFPDNTPPSCTPHAYPRVYSSLETHLNNTETPGYILQDGYTLYSTLGKKQKGKSNVYNGGIALLVKTDTYEVKANILLQDIHQITTWTLTAPYMTNPFHITGAYCSPAVGKPAITGLKWEIKPRKPIRGIEISNNPALISKIQQNTEISHNDLTSCHPMTLTT